MSGVFRNIDPSPTPSPTQRVCPPPAPKAGVYTLAGRRGGWGVNSSEDAGQCSVLNICKYFVVIRDKTFRDELYQETISSSPAGYGGD
jgi:hypothetical protein